MSHFPIRFGSAQDHTVEAARLHREIASMATYGVQYWPIFLFDNEPGLHLLPACQGCGLAVEAGRAAARFAFDTLGAKALFATGLMHPWYLLTREEAPVD